MAKKIFSVGFDFPGGFAEDIHLNSDRSLLDADIVVFKPSVESIIFRADYMEPVRLNASEAIQWRRIADHWNSQLWLALKAGKTIFIFLSTPIHLWSIEAPHSYSYKMIPIPKGSFVRATGKHIKMNADHKYLINYWKEFEAYSAYRVYMEETNLIRSQRKQEIKLWGQSNRIRGL